ncbi:sigma-70 family RNA polymerase sigma factor [Candidatus Saccharibacteria bacterium]|nr:sigma-70 family RNA polymerase sigma factor [Candidatus Saccharibacteria bacterium]MBI3337972.1 sigma-70 family RNA polymerase sigma factor [Candidatus Saccharibacteria bacterium]
MVVAESRPETRPEMLDTAEAHFVVAALANLMVANAEELNYIDNQAVLLDIYDRRQPVKRSPTGDISDTTQLYLNEVGQYPLLEKDEEIALAQLIEYGRITQARLQTTSTEHSVSTKDIIDTGARAKEVFILSNLRLVIKIARTYNNHTPPGKELLDLIQAGNLGLEHAVDKFRWEKGFKFSTYAIAWIRQSIVRDIYSTASIIRLPDGVSEELRQAIRYSDGPNNLTPDMRRLKLISMPMSLNYSIGESGATVEFGDTLPDNNIGPEERVLQDESTAIVLKLIADLGENSMTIFKLFYGLDGTEKMKQQEIADKLGINIAEVRKTLNKGLSNLRSKLHKEGLYNRGDI